MSAISVVWICSPIIHQSQVVCCCCCSSGCCSRGKAKTLNYLICYTLCEAVVVVVLQLLFAFLMPVSFLFNHMKIIDKHKKNLVKMFLIGDFFMHRRKKCKQTGMKWSRGNFRHLPAFLPPSFSFLVAFMFYMMLFIVVVIVTVLLHHLTAFFSFLLSLSLVVRPSITMTVAIFSLLLFSEASPKKKKERKTLVRSASFSHGSCCFSPHPIIIMKKKRW